MLHVDATELYELPEAGRMLFADPARLRRWARQGRVPLLRQGEVEALPRAWVDAETGRTATDTEALRAYWLERLAPAPPEARRPPKDRAGLPRPVLDPEETARRVFADPLRLARLARDGTLPALRVDGSTVYDAELADLVSRSSADEEARAEAGARRGEVVRWTRFEYVTGFDEGAALPATEAPPAPKAAVAAAPRAWQLPDDVASLESLPAEESASGSRLIEADGFATEDEDP